MKRTVLVTGGCGYVGSHVVRQLSEAGFSVVVIDNLSTGFRDALLHNEPLYVADLCEPLEYRHVFERHKIFAIMDFAASIVVPESVENPLLYYRNNVTSLINLLNLALEFKVHCFVFSSTATVYGETLQESLHEKLPVQPTNPYGWTKGFGEQILKDVSQAHGMRVMTLRYFNVAGADPKSRMGQRTPNATHLVKVACEVALGKRPHLSIFGRNYPTEDGTGVRDYIHIEDLASAHLAALEALIQGSESHTMNCGYGSGFSVLEVLDAFEEVLGRPLPTVDAPRRPGDPPRLVADVQKIHRILPKWKPQFASLRTIVETALNWEKTQTSNRIP